MCLGKGGWKWGPDSGRRLKLLRFFVGKSAQYILRGRGRELGGRVVRSFIILQLCAYILLNFRDSRFFKQCVLRCCRNDNFCTYLWLHCTFPPPHIDWPLIG